MVKRCQWGLCKSDSRYPDRIKDVKFIPFPKPRRNLEKCKRWIKACGRPHQQLNVDIVDGNYSLFVCSKHFPDGEPSERCPDPLPADPMSTSCTPARPPPKKRPMSEPPRKKKRLLTEVPSDNNENDILPSRANGDTLAEVQSDNNDNNINSAEKPENSNSYLSTLDLLALAAENRLLKEKLAKQVLENEDLRRSIPTKKLEEPVVIKPKFSVETVKKSTIKDNFKYYTGFSHEQFMNIFKFLVPSKQEVPLQFSKTISSIKHMPLEDQFLLTMIKLRLNFEFKHIAYLFEMSTQDVGCVFRAWVNYMFYRFGSVSIWPDRDIIIKKMPPKFREDFPTTMVILDGTEIKMERPSALRSQSQCYSDYKSATTLKGLVGIDPRGSFIFISMLFSGSISDKKITSDSGLLTVLQQLLDCGKLKKGDSVMVDKGFPIQGEIEKLGLKLFIPPFAPGSGQMTAADVALTKKIAAHRVHVERAISRAKKFKIIDDRLDLNLFPCANQIWFSCYLTSFMPYLIKDE